MEKEYALKEIPEIAKQILTEATHKVVLFYGDMGVGKTTLIKEICKHLGVKDITHSPTFSIVNEYVSSGDAVYHFDFYRLTKEEEAYDIGVEDYLYSDNWCFIEWPENIKNLLPLESTEVYLSLLEGGKRNIQLKNNV
ncbi:tRNA (adenosine(37)-N6)-threonylcarbamoyltransferase complex ATPase subunit type 1 TsaE [Flavobacteriaceae bacterium S356]|uniref:tRNA threonylcarbamoyladenosine biosynthesis protein TsaE n=1 Tax=Asprobacillus argus TaxID=3076534 RepID=A0ABU3LFC3_9FLAO|nr:tRNA (adenosine(37)-N6)-threonylcarbamoyltransferase complex ATPase subunit type 1 TsaE [Flavobacteriaceae bacterium S356]